MHEVLELTVIEAIQFFAQISERKNLSQPLDVLEEVGLGYLRLGQPLNTLSGGESQRLKLVRRLSEARKSKRETPGDGARGNLFIFDEPTTGLHFDDVAMLLQVFQRLVDAGHSLIVIEHNLEVIKCADWIIDLGPEAGDEGGEIVAAGTPEQVATIEASHTGRALKQLNPRAVEGSRGESFKVTWQDPSTFAGDDGREFALRVAEGPLGEAPNGAGEARALQ